MIAPNPPDEAARLAALARYQILDTPPDAAFEDLVSILAGICNVPISAVSLVDQDRQWFKAQRGLEVSETHRDLSFCAHAILDPKALLVVEDALNDPRFVDNPLVTGEMGIRFYAGAPLVTPDGHALGALCVLDHQPRHLSAFQQEALKGLARQVIRVMELRHVGQQLHHQLAERDWYEARLLQTQAALEAQNAALTAQARVDPLTGVANRRAFNDLLNQAHAVLPTAPDEATVSLMMVDLDHFKRINDTHGHPTGDQVLIQVAQALGEALGDARVSVARIGGEEFALVLPGYDASEALALGNRLRRHLADLQTPCPITVSIGVAVAQAGEPPNAWYARADAALYAAKAAGRNRVCLADAFVPMLER